MPALNVHDLALAYALSAVAGLRASLTVLALSVAVHLHALVPPAAVAWLGSDVTLAVAAAFTLADLLADKVPWVDHLLHLLHTALAPVAGGVAVFAADPSAGGAVPLLALLGAGNALGVHGLKSATRAGSTAVSLGALNPVVSVVEDVLAVLLLAASFAAPVLTAIVVLLATLALIALARRIAAALRRRAVAP